MDPLGVPRWLQTLQFGGVIVWETLAALLFWRALGAFKNRNLRAERQVLAAFAVNLALWAAFQVLDEVFLAYQPEGVHRAIFTNQLLTIGLFAVLPHDGSH
jgi:hypothetical protein